MRSKVAVIGAGMVGASFAYVLMVRGLVRELALVDSDPEKARGEAMDLSHGLSFVSPVSIEGRGLRVVPGRRHRRGHGGRGPTAGGDPAGPGPQERRHHPGGGGKDP